MHARRGATDKLVRVRKLTRTCTFQICITGNRAGGIFDYYALKGKDKQGGEHILITGLFIGWKIAAPPKIGGWEKRVSARGAFSFLLS